MSKEKLSSVAITGRALEQAQWRLPSKFQLDDAMLAKSDAEQTRLSALAAQPFGQPSVQDVYRARAVVVAEHLRDAIDHVSKQISAAILSGEEADLRNLQEAKIALQHRLAENFALFGRFDLSVIVEPDEAYREHYQRILEAIWRPDSEWCQCEDHRGSGDYADISTSKQYVKEEVWSIRDGCVVFLLACAGCPMLNATSLPNHLRQQRAHRARAQQLVQGMSIEDAERTLRAKNHTAAKLLK